MLHRQKRPLSVALGDELVLRMLALSSAQTGSPLPHRIWPTGPLTFGFAQTVRRVLDRPSAWRIHCPSPAPGTLHDVEVHPPAFDLDRGTSTPPPTGHAPPQSPRVWRIRRPTVSPPP